MSISLEFGTFKFKQQKRVNNKTRPETRLFLTAVLEEQTVGSLILVLQDCLPKNIWVFDSSQTQLQCESEFILSKNCVFVLRGCVIYYMRFLRYYRE